MVCRNICEKIYSKIIVGTIHLAKNIVEDVSVICFPGVNFVLVVACSYELLLLKLNTK